MRELHELPYAAYLGPLGEDPLPEADYDCVRLESAEYKEIDLRNVRFAESALADLVFAGGDLAHTRFTDVWLNHVDMTATSLAETTWLDAEIGGSAWIADPEQDDDDEGRLPRHAGAEHRPGNRVVARRDGRPRAADGTGALVRGGAGPHRDRLTDFSRPVPGYRAAMPAHASMKGNCGFAGGRSRGSNVEEPAWLPVIFVP